MADDIIAVFPQDNHRVDGFFFETPCSPTFRYVDLFEKTEGVSKRHSEVPHEELQVKSSLVPTQKVRALLDEIGMEAMLTGLIDSIGHPAVSYANDLYNGLALVRSVYRLRYSDEKDC